MVVVMLNSLRSGDGARGPYPADGDTLSWACVVPKTLAFEVGVGNEAKKSTFDVFVTFFSVFGVNLNASNIDSLLFGVVGILFSFSLLAIRVSDISHMSICDIPPIGFWLPNTFFAGSFRTVFGGCVLSFRRAAVVVAVDIDCTACRSLSLVRGDGDFNVNFFVKMRSGFERLLEGFVDNTFFVRWLLSTDFRMTATSTLKLRLSVNCKISLDDHAIKGLHTISMLTSALAAISFEVHSN